MTVKAGVPIHLLHKEAEEASQPNTCLVEKKKRTVFNIVSYLINVYLFQTCVNYIKLQLSMSATCPPLIVRVHRSMDSTLVYIVAYINQLEGISNLEEMQ